MKLRVGIIGSGFGLYGLLPAFRGVKECEVVALCGKKSERLLSYCESIGLSNLYTDWREMLEKEDLDAVAIAVVPSAQYEIAKVALKKGLHIFAEKPLAANIQEAKELAYLAKERGLTTAVDFIFPEIDEWQKVKEFLVDKRYGEIKHISVSWEFQSYDIKNKVSSWKTDDESGGGALSFYLSHTLHYVELFAGKILSASTVFTYAKESLGGGEVGVDSILSFENGVTGNIHFSCNAVGRSLHQVTLILEQGTLVLESKSGVTDHFTLFVYSRKGVEEVHTVKETQEGEDERVKMVRRLAERFVKSAVSKSVCFPSFEEGLRVEELIELIKKGK